MPRTPIVNPAVDRRVRRTRKQLRDALVALVLERGWDAVSVKNVCERADIGRSTFYVHFADKEELLLSGFDELHVTLERERVDAPEPFGFVASLTAHASDNVRLFRALIGKPSGQAVQRRFREVVTRLIEAEIGKRGLDDRAVRWVARYVSGGLVEMLFLWLDRPSSLEPATLIDLFSGLTRGALRACRGERAMLIGAP